MCKDLIAFYYSVLQKYVMEVDFKVFNSKHCFISDIQQYSQGTSRPP